MVDRKLPLIIGSKASDQRLVRGLPLRGSDIETALEIAKFFEGNKNLSPYSIIEIDIRNLSKIILL